MKVAFLIPPVLDATNNVDRCFGCNYSIYFLPLLPVLYCATVIREKVEGVSTVDFAAGKKRERDFRDFILREDADVYVFYSVFLSQATDLAARRIIRQLKPGKRFIYFGPQATYAPEKFLDAPDTFVVRGEPEFIMRELIAALGSGLGVGTIQGVSYFDGAALAHNPPAPLIQDIDTIPIPDRSLLDHGPYCNPKLRHLPHTAALTSRGCFGQCWFCVPNSLSYARELEHKKHFGTKPPPRVHSAARVIEEFRRIAQLGFKSVSIIDDQFVWDESRTVEICEGIEDLGLEWSCLCRPEKITGRIAHSLARAGCAYVDLGTESFDADILKDIKKDVSPDATRKAVGLLKDAGVQVEINILLGATPRETERTIKKTLDEVKRLQADYVLFSIANPFPGTEFYAAAKKEGWLYYGEYVPVDPAKSAIISYPHLSKKRLEQLCARAYLSYYFHPRYILKQLSQLKGPADFWNKFRTALSFLRKNYL